MYLYHLLLISAFFISVSFSYNATNEKRQAPYPRRPYTFDYLIAANDYYDTEGTVVFLDTDIPESVINKYKLSGKTVFCFFNGGAWEFWREDANLFPEELLGNDYDGWPGEKWLDITNTELLVPLIRERLRLAAAKGCNGIDANNLYGYKLDTGFDITYQDQLFYNRFLASEIRVQGMLAGVNDDPDQTEDLVDYFDFAVALECTVRGNCDRFQMFVDNEKPVFALEYTDSYDEKRFLQEVCPRGIATGVSFTLKHKEAEDGDFFVTC